ncbi:MAG: RDD family protein [Acidobacteria bacterium]|nr:RDD family protein [Acidobacteriota bacterium]
MKCPSCGFDSFLETERCKKCGHPFGIGDDEEELSGFLSTSSVEDAPEAEIIASEAEPSPPLEPAAAHARPLVESPIHTVPEVRAGLRLPDPAPDPVGTPPDWKAELDQRVETFRRRRARTRGVSDSNRNLEFDFEEPPSEAAPPQVSTPPERPTLIAPEIDIELPRSSPTSVEHVETGPMEIADQPVSGPLQEHHDPFPPQDVRPVEFVLDHAPSHSAAESGPVTFEILLAPMPRRMAGGMIDAAVLVFSAGVFTLIFWRAGGHISSHPLTLLVVAFVAVFLVLVYFGAFTAIIATTPGLLWMGIEVRNISGGPPTLRQSFWRAFGCLVSASAMLLGFVWALFDNDSLTWHDRMSETYLAPSDATTKQGV